MCTSFVVLVKRSKEKERHHFAHTHKDGKCQVWHENSNSNNISFLSQVLFSFCIVMFVYLSVCGGVTMAMVGHHQSDCSCNVTPFSIETIHEITCAVGI